MLTFQHQSKNLQSYNFLKVFHPSDWPPSPANTPYVTLPDKQVDMIDFYGQEWNYMWEQSLWIWWHFDMIVLLLTVITPGSNDSVI